MFNAIKLIKIFFISILLITLFIVFLIYFLSYKSVPDYNNSYDLDQTFDSIKIVRDRNAVPHIFADENLDVFFGLGFAHAQDRLWQMVLTRGFAYGNLSEILGKQSIQTDDFMKRLDIKNVSNKTLQFQSEKTQEALVSYSQGVNSWLDLINKQSLGRGSPEFFIYDNPIKIWEPVDSISILKLNGLLGTSQIHSETLMLKTILKLNADKAFDLFTQNEINISKINAQLLEEYEGIRYLHNNEIDEIVTYNPFISNRHLETAEMISIAPSNTIKTGSLLAHNIHSTLTSPSKFMLARLEFNNNSVIGISIPGVPAIVSGKNINVGWARGIVDADQIDLVIEELLPEDRRKYKSIENYETIKERKTIIKIKDQPDKTINLSWTSNGPIIPEKHFGLELDKRSNKAISFKSNILLEKDLTMTAYIDLMYSKNIAEALTTSKNHVTPIQNLMLVDKENIAIKLIGKIPKRNVNHDTQGRYPSSGWKKENKWDGFYSYEKNPAIINPPEGYIISTGNNSFNNDFPLNVTFNWADTQKISRLQARISERDIFTTQSLRDLQLDTVSNTARSLLGLIAEDLWYEGSLAPKGSKKNTRQNILKVLSNWNGDMKIRSFEPVIYKEWLKLLYKRMIEDDLGSIYVEFGHFDPIFIERAFKNINNSKQWCDIVQTNRIETCQEIAKDSLDDTIFYLSEKFGKNVNDWNTEKYNKLVHYHNPLGAKPFLKWLFNIVHRDTIGDFTLHGGKSFDSNNGNFHKSHASVYKGIYDMADENNSIYILSTGQSGHFLSKHYEDLSEIYANEEYLPMSLNKNLIKVGAKGTTYIN